MPVHIGSLHGGWEGGQREGANAMTKLEKLVALKSEWERPGQCAELSWRAICYLLAEDEENEEVQCINVMWDPSDPWEFGHFKKALYQHQCGLAEQQPWVDNNFILLENQMIFYHYLLNIEYRQFFMEFVAWSFLFGYLSKCSPILKSRQFLDCRVKKVEQILH